MREVAKEIADDARDPDDGKDIDGVQVRRDEWPDYLAGKLVPWSAIPVVGELRNGVWRDGLVEICGATPRAISDALTALGRAGYEMRQPITKDGKPVVDARGRTVFAARGHAVRFQVLPLAPRPTAQRMHQSATNDDPQSTHQGATNQPKVAPERDQSTQRSHPAVSKVAPECDPVSSSPPQEKSPLSPRAKIARRVREAVPSATEREIDLFIAQVKAERSPDHIDLYVASYPLATITKKIEAIRTGGVTVGPHPVAAFRAAQVDDTPTPTPAPYADTCKRCFRPGHDADNCPTCPEPSPRPTLTAVETPCAAGEKCRQRRTPVPDGQEYHEACQALGGLRAVGQQSRGADRDEVGRRIAAEQLAEMQTATPSRDGGHAA